MKEWVTILFLFSGTGWGVSPNFDHDFASESPDLYILMERSDDSGEEIRFLAHDVAKYKTKRETIEGDWDTIARAALLDI